MPDLSAVESIFLAAVEKPSAADRAAFLDAACGDPEVRGHVERLLAAHPRVGAFLNGGPNVTEDYGPLAERPGTVIGPYKLMEQIGEGGMGLVFVAEQHQPVRRKVALKIIKPGMDSREVIARFEAERQALAMMDHPHIARVLDAGATEAGRPYFVMELVRGVPITEYCDANNLTPRDRLGLFVQVCQAVQHAHQKGIIHRDLKPSNIMVAPHDGVPVVKVIDFGVAKALGQQLTERTLYTRFAQMVGTPLYMSPEQAEVNQLDVDTRSDVYSLGVLLYELLTSTTPFDRKRFQTAAYDEIRRIIREEEPPKPSTRLTSLGETLTRVSASRGTDPSRLSKLVRGELDWIVMKCLEKDRTRRYDTVAGLAKDVQRYLKDEAVEARPASLAYRFGKVYKRNRVAVLVTAGFATLLLVGLALVTWKWQDERTARRDADVARREVEEKAREILVSDEQMSEANASLDRASIYVSIRQWSQAEAAYNRAIELRPKQSVVWLQRGELYGRMGLLNLAAADYSRAFDRREPERVEPWYDRALLQLSQRDEAGYRETCRQAIARFPEVSNHRGRFLLARLCSLAPGGLPEEERWSRLVTNPAGTESGYVWVGYYIRGLGYFRAGRWDDAIRDLRESLARANYHARAMCYPVLAMALLKSGQIDAARHELNNSRKEVDRGLEGAIGARDRIIWWTWWYDWTELLMHHAEAHQMIDGTPPPEDPRTRVMRGRALAALGRTDAAAAEYTAAIRLKPDHFATHAEVFKFYADAKRWDEAEAEVREMTRLRPNDPQVHVTAFRGFADNGYMKEADLVLAAARRLRPADVPLRLEKYRYHVEREQMKEAEDAYAAAVKERAEDVPFRIKCGDFSAELKQWATARDEYLRILDSGTIGDGEINRDTWLRLACLQLYLGDVAGYRRTCTKLVEKHENDTEVRNLNSLIRICLLHPDPGVPPERLAAIAKKLAAGDDPSQGLHYAVVIGSRLGKDDVDLAALETATARFKWDTQRTAIARVHHARGDFAAARNAMKLVDVRNRRVDPLTGSTNRWDFNLETQLWYHQAEEIVQFERWSVAFDLHDQKQFAAAIEALTPLLKPEDKTPFDWSARGNCYAELGCWKEAAADHDRAFALGRNFPPAFFSHCLCALQVGDKEMYHKLCADQLQRHADSKDRQILNNVAALCALDPAAEALAGRALELVEKALDKSTLNNFVNTRAILLYRLKRYDDAHKQLRDLVAQPGYAANAYDWLFLSMTCAKLKQGDQARKYYEQATASLAANPAAKWQQRVELERFRAEAAGLIKAN